MGVFLDLNTSGQKVLFLTRWTRANTKRITIDGVNSLGSGNVGNSHFPIHIISNNALELQTVFNSSKPIEKLM